MPLEYDWRRNRFVNIPAPENSNHSPVARSLVKLLELSLQSPSEGSLSIGAETKTSPEKAGKTVRVEQTLTAANTASNSTGEQKPVPRIIPSLLDRFQRGRQQVSAESSKTVLQSSSSRQQASREEVYVEAQDPQSGESYLKKVED